MKLLQRCVETADASSKCHRGEPTAADWHQVQALDSPGKLKLQEAYEIAQV